ncbi:MAG: HEAT repeat domain-containing protein [Planctomycetota bacterium]|nr:HEAT repeat domain-containing protein [Planctomycetota bacterium]
MADTMLTRGEPDEASRIHGPTALEIVDMDSMLRSAQAVLARGERDEASRIYKKMMAADQPPRIRAAALRGLTCAGSGAARLTYIDLLKTKDPAILQMIGAMMADMPGPEATKAFAAALPALGPEAQAGVLAGLAGRGDKEALPAIRKAADSDEPSVQRAAIRAMGSLGDAGNIVPLAALAAREGDVGSAAVASLNRISGPGVNEAMMKAAGEGKAPERVKLIGVLASRGDRAAAPAITTWLKDSDASVRTAACKALGVLGGAEALPLLVERAVAAEGAPERTAAAQALAIVAKGVQDESARTGPIIAALAKAPAAARVELVGVLGRLGGPAALAAVRGQLGGEAAARKAAVRALADWPDAAALADVQALARTETDEGNRTLALRGYVGQAAAAGQGAPATATMLEEAMKLARQPDEKKAVLAILPKFACPEALKLAESAATDPAVAAEAKVAAEKIRKLDKPAPGK